MTTLFVSIGSLSEACYPSAPLFGDRHTIERGGRVEGCCGGRPLTAYRLPASDAANHACGIH